MVRCSPPSRCSHLAFEVVWEFVEGFFDGINTFVLSQRLTEKAVSVTSWGQPTAGCWAPCYLALSRTHVAGYGTLASSPPASSRKAAQCRIVLLPSFHTGFMRARMGPPPLSATILLCARGSSPENLTPTLL